MRATGYDFEGFLRVTDYGLIWIRIHSYFHYGRYRQRRRATDRRGHCGAARFRGLASALLFSQFFVSHGANRLHAGIEVFNQEHVLRVS